MFSKKIILFVFIRVSMDRICFSLVLLCFNSHLSAQQIISVADFGAVPDSRLDATESIQKAIEACRKYKSATLVFPKGKYQIYPDKAVQKEYNISNTSSLEECPLKIKTIGLFFKDLRNITLEGNGSMLLFHDKMITLCFENCSNIIVKNLQEDYVRPTMSEMCIISHNADTVEAIIHRQSNYKIESGKLKWVGANWETTRSFATRLDTSNHVMYYSSWVPFEKSRAVILSDGKVRFIGVQKWEGYAGNVLSVRDIIRDQVGGFILNSKNIRFENVVFHYLHGLGIVSQLSENLTFDRVIFVPPQSSGRYMASSADMLHFSSCKGSIKINNCVFSGAHDDFINVHGTHLQVVGQDRNKITVKFMHPQTYGFNNYNAGDKIAFISNQTLRQVGIAKVISAEMTDEFSIMLTLDRIPSLADTSITYLVENITRTPSVSIRNNYFEYGLTRGILLTTRGKIEVEGNVFNSSGMSAILISDDANYWFESGMVKDVLIKNNTFINCGYNGGVQNAIIAIWPENNVTDKKYPVHSNVRITSNRFDTYDYPVLIAKSTSGLKFSGNTIRRTYTLQARAENRYAINLASCTDVVVKDNKWGTDVLSTQIKIRDMLESDVKGTGFLFVDDK